MSISRRSTNRFNASIWPGFVDAMTGLLLVLMFVLTVFTVLQFTLKETISGQEDQLNELTSEVASLAHALGLEQERSAGLANQVGQLTTDLTDATAQSRAQAAQIANLLRERDAQAEALLAAENRITGFEAQVAGLLAQRSDLRDQVSTLEDEQGRLIDEVEATQLALAQARSEVDAQAEAARLAAARREALEALVADLQSERDESVARLTELEAEALTDAAAAEALRERLANADAELTAMTLALEEERKKAEETLTLLAAAKAARADLDTKLAAALLAQSQIEADLTEARAAQSDVDARLAATLDQQQLTERELLEAQEALAEAEMTREELTTRLSAALLAQEESQRDLDTVRDELETRLAAALLAQESLTAQVAALSEVRSETEEERASLEAELSAALAARLAAENQLNAQMTEAERQAALLAAARDALSDEEAVSEESRRQIAALNANVSELRAQVQQLQSLLDIANAQDAEADIQISNLSTQLNQALARVAAENARRLELEEAERQRLEAEAKELENYRSEFFGQLREVLAGQEGVRIEGDRFVFSSEVLFDQGAAELAAQGEAEIAKVATLLKQISSNIPNGIDWIIRVDGHTDNIPLSGLGEFKDNWELSQARALSVVRYMVDEEGIPPTRLSANGFGEWQPLNAADTDAARAQNRRIELKLTER